MKQPDEFFQLNNLAQGIPREPAPPTCSACIGPLR